MGNNETVIFETLFTKASESRISEIISLLDYRGISNICRQFKFCTKMYDVIETNSSLDIITKFIVVIS